MLFCTIVFSFAYFHILLCVDSAFCILGTMNNLEAAKFTLCRGLNFSQILCMFRFESYPNF